jgi:hypothetical protein
LGPPERRLTFTLLSASSAFFFKIHKFQSYLALIRKPGNSAPLLEREFPDENYLGKKEIGLFLLSIKADDPLRKFSSEERLWIEISGFELGALGEISPVKPFSKS